MSRRLRQRFGCTPAGRERGVVLMIALIVLVAMTLAALAIMRSLDTGTLVAGNIGFRQAAVATADSGVETARTWIMANVGLLTADQPGTGYYSTRQDSLDITGNRTEGGLDGVDWGGSDPAQPVKAFSLGTVDSSGNAVFYLIHRLCSIPGSINAPGQSCATAQISGTGSSQDAPDYSAYALAVKNQVYYRITVRVNGPKSTVSYVQAVILYD
jgi:Tfp pilus assembly protein PilX